MDTDDTPAPPPEAQLITTAREALGLTAEAASRISGGEIGAVYWRQVEKGAGWRRGKAVTARASDAKLATMAAICKVTPQELDEAGRPGAAAVLRRRRLTLVLPPPPPLREDSTDGQVRAFIAARPALRDVLEGIWRSADAEGTLLPRAGRITVMQQMAEMAEGYGSPQSPRVTG